MLALCPVEGVDKMTNTMIALSVWVAAGQFYSMLLATYGIVAAIPYVLWVGMQTLKGKRIW